MQELIRGGFEQLSKFFRKEKPDGSEMPYYVSDDYDLLYYVDPYLQNLLGRSSFQRLQTALQNAGMISDVVDIGASRNFLRGLVFLNATKTTAIDPAYKWYDHESEDPFAQTPYPYGIFGGKAERRETERLLQYACGDLQIPERFDSEGSISITGERHNQQRIFKLVSEDANEWLLDQQPQTIENFVVNRVFPSAFAWGKILSSLREGGTLLTTGYGKLEQKLWETERVEYEPDISQGGGADVDNSPLPLNANSEAIGLTHIAQIGQIHFYKKIHHLETEDVSRAILNNR